MYFHQTFTSIPLLLASGVSALDIPSNIYSFYSSLRDKGECSNKLATGFYSTDRDDEIFSYCGDHLKDNKVVYIQGLERNLADMDIDCNGVQGRGDDDDDDDDNRCSKSKDKPSRTSFRDTVRGYHRGIWDLDANVHPYVVFGNVGRGRHGRAFDPRDYDIEPLSVMAVVCGSQMLYGVWGDEDGENMVGEASLALATACFGDDMNGNNGHEKNDVLYLAFPGQDAVPGANGAWWNADNFDDFHDSIVDLGNRLIQRIPKASGNWSLAAGGRPKWKMG